MLSDATAQLLLQVLLGATALFLVRLFWVRENVRYPLFVLSIGLSIVFTLPRLIPNLGELRLVSIDMVDLAMDLMLTPFVALELFRAAPAADPPPVRYIAPSVGALLGGLFISLYLSTNPDKESLQDAFSTLDLVDTLVSMVIVGYLARKFRTGTPPGDSNTMWLRRLFFALAVLSVAATLAREFVDDHSVTTLRIVYLSAVLLITVGCLVVLKKPKQNQESAPAA